MLRRSICATVMALIMGFAPVAAGAAEENSWVGREILAKRPDVALKVGEKFGASVAELAQPMRVVQEQGDWLWIESAGRSGWLKKSDVVQVSQAVNYFNDALKREPNNAWAYNLRGLVREQQGDFQGAIGDFTQAIRNDAQMAVAYNNRGIAYDRSGDPKHAVADYSEAIKIDPSYAAAYNNRGLAHANQGELKQAIADFDQAIRFDSKFAVARNNRGVVYDQTGNLARAEQDFSGAIQLDPKFAEAYGNRGNILRRQGKYEQALKDFDQAVKFAPNDGAGYNNRAWLLATCPDEKHCDGKAAVTAATKACELSKWKNPDWLDTLAAAYARAGDFDEAAKYESQAIEHAPEAQRSDMNARLELYRSGKAYQEPAAGK
jgi:tetratricopeptide (TPR) repeat protein